MQRHALHSLAMLALLAVLAPAGMARAPGDWPAFARDFVQDDGRVIDQEAGSISTSEGQAYALFFALVANDRARFEQVLRWAENNLAAGELEARTMAWKWGRDDAGQWRVLDGNAASDADLWMAYTLYSAAERWQVPAWRLTAHAMQARVADELVREVDGRPTLLPGPEGFALADGGVRVNPSYLPLFLLRGLAREAPDGPWAAMADDLPAMLGAAPAKIAPDWLHATASGFALADDFPVGSYDAIRVYLWAGMTDEADPKRAAVLAALGGMAACVDANGRVAERVNATSGECAGTADTGFSWALLPFLMARGELARAGRVRAATAAEPLGKRYYPRSLEQFAAAWMAGRFRFSADGRLLLAGDTECAR
jgi:endoglucanase